eukprot:g5858.t1
MSFEEVRAVEDLPNCFRSLYRSFKYFNVVQSDCFQCAFHTDDHMVWGVSFVESLVSTQVVAAPTGSGKTIVMELTILRLFSRNIRNGVFQSASGMVKVIYIAPTRSLVQERVRDWNDRFGNGLDLKIKELTGDIENLKSNEIDQADIICATPEKFDAVTRKHRDHGGMRFFAEISLVLIDEVHLLNEARGSVLEAGVVSRVRVVSKLASMKQWPISGVRFVAVSATIPNANDLAIWLDAPSHGLFVYGDEVRPVKLKTIVRGYNESKNDFLFERRLNEHLLPIIHELSKGRPTFFSSRKGTTETSNQLIQQSINSPFVRDLHHLERLRMCSKQAMNKQLQQCLLHGVAFHHAGMEPTDRSLVEVAFYNQDILVLCTTGTLAMGVNLPAHLVILKGTRYYCGMQDGDTEQNGYREYDKGAALQMIGRAGRPQFDTEGVAVIMTQKRNVQRYEHLAMGCEDLESQLNHCFAEYLNAEIVLGTIRSIPLAFDWLKSTFMYIRALKNPTLYGLPANVQSRQRFDELMQERYILSNIASLETHGMVKCDAYGVGLDALECGKLMAHYYIRMKTMIKICQAPGHASIPDLIHIISNAEEMETIRLRRGEKKILNDINCRRSNPNIKYQVLDSASPPKTKQRISTPDEKIFVLINDALSDSPAETLDASLRQETIQILKIAESVTQCMTKYYGNKGSLASTANAKILSKCVKARLWEDGNGQTKQLPNIGKLLSDRLTKGGLGKLKQLSRADPRKIEALTMKHYPFGNALLLDLHKRLPPTVQLHLQALGSYGEDKIKLEVVVERVEDNASAQAAFMACSFIGGTIHNDKLIINEMINLKTFASPYVVHCLVDRSTQGRPLNIVVSLIMEKIVGLDVTKRLIIPFDLPMEEATCTPSINHLVTSEAKNNTMQHKNEHFNNNHKIVEQRCAPQEVTSDIQDAEVMNNQEVQLTQYNNQCQRGCFNQSTVENQTNESSAHVDSSGKRTKRRLNFNSFDSKPSSDKSQVQRQVLKPLNQHSNANSIRVLDSQTIESGKQGHAAIKHLQSINQRRESTWSQQTREIIESRKRKNELLEANQEYNDNSEYLGTTQTREADDNMHTPECKSLVLAQSLEASPLYKDDNQSASDTKTIFSFL